MTQKQIIAELKKLRHHCAGDVMYARLTELIEKIEKK